MVWSTKCLTLALFVHILSPTKSELHFMALLDGDNRERTGNEGETLQHGALAGLELGDLLSQPNITQLANATIDVADWHRRVFS